MIRVMSGACGVLLALSFSASVNAVLVSDRWATDSNTVGATSFVSTDEYLVSMTYGEDNLLSYPAAGGSAVVNLGGETGCASGTCWFDTLVTIDSGDITDGTFTLGFDVTNETPFTWSAYQVEFYDKDFTTITGRPSLSFQSPFAYFNESVTTPANYPDTQPLEIVRFYDGTFEPSAVSMLYKFDFEAIPQTGIEFGIRHIAITAVPVPAAVWLFGSGLLWLLGLAGRNKPA